MSAIEERPTRTKAEYTGDRVPTLFHLRREDRELLNRACKAENRTLSSMGDEIIAPALVARGYTADDRQPADSPGEPQAN